MDEKKQTAVEKDDGLFDMLPEGTRIVIHNGVVTFENLTEDFVDVALSLNPEDPDLRQRKQTTPGEDE